MNTAKHHIFPYLIAIASIFCGGFQAAALPSSTYATSSKLSKGKWTKIKVTTTGMHLITNSDLASWGFKDPAKVRIYGYGGRRQTEELTVKNYIDDLPLVQSVKTAKGIVFYAVGIDTRVSSTFQNPYGNYYFDSNPYATEAYYFLSETDETQTPIEKIQSLPVGDSPVTSFIEAVQHEQNLFSPAQSGHILLGEDFRYTPTQNFTFKIPGQIPNTPIWMQCDFYAKALSNPVELTFRANSTPLQVGANDKVLPTKEYGDTCRIRKSFDLNSVGETLQISIQSKATGTVNVSALDKLTINYTREIVLQTGGSLNFYASEPVRMSTTAQASHVWDVTDPRKVEEVTPIATSGAVQWNNPYAGMRSYVAWDENGVFPSPKFAGTITNQNLHAEPTPDMVIITHPQLYNQSKRLADIHARMSDSLSCLIVTPQQVYNEFSSGTPDIFAFRKMLKMFYDRPEKRLKYVLLMGGVTFDHRGLTSNGKPQSAYTLPIWQTDDARTESSSFCSDDFITFLEDESGQGVSGNEKMSIAVGRIPATTTEHAKTYLDRLEKYLLSPQSGEWRTRIALLADDEDRAIHMSQTDDFESKLRETASGNNFTYRKVYVDAFEKQAGVVKPARTKLHNLLNEGVVWWNYVGHASTTTLSGEGVLTLTDLSSLYLRKAPFFYGATCSFSHWDGPQISGLEQLMLSDAGGLIGGISAVRPVYITRNGVLTNAMGSYLLRRNAEGKFNSVAEAFRLAKNSIGTDSNKLRYVMMGDPAAPLATPNNIVTIDSVNHTPVTSDSQPTLEALSRATLSGRVLDHKGDLMTDFSGWIELALYDAETSVTTLGRGKDGKEWTYDEQGDRLYAGRALVNNGLWQTTFVVPAEISDNFRPATLSMYAESADCSAAGVDRHLYVYGQSATELADTIAPSIDQLYLNHESFDAKESVNSAPMLIAHVSDNVGINLSNAGVGHQMSLRLDKDKNYTDLSNYYIPDEKDPAAGQVFYQLPELDPGHHTAILRVWDVNSNAAERELSFFVDPTVAPKIFEVYTDANPAVASANFFIKHNRPDAMITLTIEVFSLDGRMIWSGSQRGRADKFSSTPINWNLTTTSGSSVNNGIYLYRATVKTDSTDKTPETHSSATRRIAVVR